MPADFVDSNILIYMITGGVAQRERAAELLAASVTISVQVMNEVANVARRKLRYDWEEVRSLLREIETNADIRPLTLDTHRLGLRLARRYNFAIYDALIVASALEGGCGILWSEDMQHGMVVDDRLTIQDPFLGVPA